MSASIKCRGIRCPSIFKYRADRIKHESVCEHYQRYLERAPKRILLEDGGYQCTRCSKVYKDKTAFSRHKKAHCVISVPGNTNTHKHVCGVCSMEFLTPSKLKRHQLTHDSKQLYTCQGCNFIYQRLDHYEKHVRRCELNVGMISEEIEQGSATMAQRQDGVVPVATVPVEPEPTVDDLIASLDMNTVSQLQQLIQSEIDSIEGTAVVNDVPVPAATDTIIVEEHGQSPSDSDTGDIEEQEQSHTGDIEEGPLTPQTPKRTKYRHAELLRKSLASIELTPKRVSTLLSSPTNGSPNIEKLVSLNIVDQLQYARLGVMAVENLRKKRNPFDVKFGSNKGVSAFAKDVHSLFGETILEDDT